MLASELIRLLQEKIDEDQDRHVAIWGEVDLDPVGKVTTTYDFGLDTHVILLVPEGCTTW